MIYYYLNKINPNLDLIHQEVYNSNMTNKQIQYCVWDLDTKILQCIFNMELNEIDLDIFNSIIRKICQE
jgi:hypothetical protein